MRISDWSSDVCSSDLSEERTARDYGSAETAQKRWKDVWAAGQGIEAIHSVAAVSDIVDDIEAGYWHSVERLNGIAVARRPAQVASGTEDRKSVVWGKSVSVRVDLGGRRLIKNKHNTKDR